YRYYSGPVQYPFGFGLSYASFEYSWKSQPEKKYQANETITVSVNVKNTGKMDADEVLQAYIQYPNLERMPLKELKGFQRVTVQQNGEQVATIKIPVKELQKWDPKKHQFQLYKGNYHLLVGSNSSDVKLNASFTL
ncbi:MAG: glycosyl hydrolase, partial [Pedobacter sp.]|nr:glycosyl hydrolase [Pedobacter sp.]